MEGGSLYISHEKYIKDGKVLNHLELMSKVLLRPFTDLSDLKKKLWRGDLYKYPMKNILRTAKFLTTWGLSQRYFPGL
jgi:hypothetical protein